MEVRIGVQSVPRELIVETDESAEDVERDLSAALNGGGDNSGGGSVFALAVSKGGKILVPADKIAYVEICGPEARRVGFGNIGLRSTGVAVTPRPPGILPDSWPPEKDQPARKYSPNNIASGRNSTAVGRVPTQGCCSAAGRGVWRSGGQRGEPGVNGSAAGSR